MNRFKASYIWLLISVIFLIVSIGLRQFTENMQQEKKLILSSEDSKGVSPELNLAISLGVFRSVVVNHLWMRAIKLQQDKRFYEIVQLYDMIGKLQPHNGKIWAHSAWNMAFNISVEHPVGIERWRWVQNGIDRLKKHGLKYNPEDGLLYKELAWIYSFKIARHLDDSHIFYKTKLAEDMTSIFEPFEINATKVQNIINSGNAKYLEEAIRVSEKLEEIKQMDLKTMVSLENNPDFGPLDWRMGEAHAIYWSKEGINRKAYNVSPGDLQRLCYQAMQHLLRHGTLVYIEENEKQPAHVILWPDYRQVDPINRMFVKQIKYFKSNRLSTVGPRSAYVYFLKESLEILFLAGQDDMAEKLFQDANKLMPNILGGHNAKEHTRRDIEARIKDMTALQFNGLISSIILQHYWWLGYGDVKRSKALLARVNLMWEKNNEVNKNKKRRNTKSIDELSKSILFTIMEKKLFHKKILTKLENMPVVQEKLKGFKAKL